MRVSASSRLSDESLDRADRVDLKLVDQADGVGELERELRLGPLDEVESGRARGDALTLDRGNTLRGRRVGDRRAHLGRRAVRRHDLTQPVLAGTVGLDVGAQGVRPAWSRSRWSIDPSSRLTLAELWPVVPDPA